MRNTTQMECARNAIISSISFKEKERKIRKKLTEIENRKTVKIKEFEHIL